MNETNIFEVREEPIKVAEMLICADGEFKSSQLARALGAPETTTYNLYSKSDLREIAKHLLAYCENGEESD